MDRILAVVARDRVTPLYSVATLYRRILGQIGIESRFDISSLRGANGTGEPMEGSVRAEWSCRFGCCNFRSYSVLNDALLKHFLRDIRAQCLLRKFLGAPSRGGFLAGAPGPKKDQSNYRSNARTSRCDISNRNFNVRITPA